MFENAFAYDVTLDDFQQKVVEASFNVPVVIDFWAEWCAPCRALKPMLEKLASEYGGRFLLARINSDENQPLAAEFGVRSIPAVKVIVRGEQVDEFTGVLPESKLREFIERQLPSPAEAQIEAANALRQQGDLQAAAGLLGQALEIDPHHETARLDLAALRLQLGDTEAASALLEAPLDWKDRTRFDALHAELALHAQARPGESIDLLQQQVTAAPDDLDARLRLANALARAKHYREALDQQLEIVRRNRQWNEQAGRKSMLTLFNLLAADPVHEALMREYRVALARTLN